MQRGGKRANSGRKKIDGKQIKVIVPSEILEKIEKKIDGNTISEKIRKCIERGLKDD
ncbi:MAG: hypothetical protein ACRC6E_00850 [Fusobacteriaceae bacterium]